MSVTTPQGQRRILTAELLREIRTSLRVNARQASSRRAEPRVALRSTVDVVPCSDDATGPFQAWLIELSISGIALLSRTKLTKGEQLIIHLPYATRRQGGCMPLLCIVANCRPMSDGTHRIGCIFVDR